ncbi:MAG: phosphate ABC transporter ATP-binding protein [Candidatus Latescibacteria bacterium]|nr:phosphate ABC transporter ATP-binding protein [Candidatus Latescibacterota bacterium]
MVEKTKYDTADICDLLSVQNLNLWFGDKQILKNINMNTPCKKLTAIIGPSGCGKSTLIRCFNRMNDLIAEARLQGIILIDGIDIHSGKMDIYELRMKVGMVFQKPNPFPKSILDNVLFGLKIKGGMNKDQMQHKVEKSLRDAWLWDEVKDRLHDNAFSLSGGQQQRLCIARALATDPEIILLDEPTSALDPQSTTKIEDLLVELKNNVTIIQVTHNIAQAARISDYIAFIYLGELVEFGLTEKLVTTPRDKRTEAYLTGKFG